MSKKRYFYSEGERLSILRDYYSSGMSMYACVRKYQLSTNGLLIRWKKLYESHPEIVSLHPKPEELDMANRDKESPESCLSIFSRCKQYQDGNDGSVKTFRELSINVSTNVVNETENRLLKSGKDRYKRAVGDGNSYETLR